MQQFHGAVLCCVSKEKNENKTGKEKKKQTETFLSEKLIINY